MQIRYTKQAVEDLNHAYEYIAADNPHSARVIIERIENAIETILVHTGIGRSGRVGNTREFVVLGTPFIIVYRVDGKALQILSVLHSSRRYPFA